MEDFIAETQKVLGAVITTPKLSEKLLGKPPFRFLHDIVTSFIKTANFPEGYYSPDMLDSAKVTDKEHKLEFIMKLINVVQTATGQTTTCHPAKTIAGQEPEGTNNLLQLLASCGALSKDQKDKAVKKALGGGDDEAEEAAAAKAAKEREERERYKREKEEKEKKEKGEREVKEERDERKKKERDEKESKDDRDERKKRERDERELKEERDERKKKERDDKEKAADVEKGKGATPPMEEEEHYQSTNKKERKDKDHDKRDKHSKQKSGDVSKPTKLIPSSAGGDRPGTATARKPPPSVRSNTVEEETRVDNPTNVAAVIKEERKAGGKKEESGGEDGKDWMKLVEEHDTASRTHHHANADEAKGYLGKEAIVARDRQAEEKKLELERGEGGDSGIVLRSTKSKDKGSSVGDTELSHLKDQLQMLTKAANPLGKFLEAIHDDMDAMSRELEMWRMEARTQASAANDAHRQTQESLHDVHGKTQAVEERLSDQLLRTNLLRSTILGNDRVIETMINMVVSHDTGGGAKRK